MSITIDGFMRDDARSGRRGVNDAALSLMLRLDGMPCPLEAHILVGTSEADHIRAPQLAALCPRGAPVRLVGKQIERVDDHGELRYVLRGLTRAVVAGHELLFVPPV